MSKNIIINLVLEITAMIIIIFISIPIWNRLDNDEIHEIASYYDNYYYINYDILNNDNGKMITVYNDSNTLEHYNLIMKINKEYLNNLIIYVNEEEKEVSSLKTIAKGDIIYVVLDSNFLVANKKYYNIHTNNNVYYNIDVLDNI